MTYHFANENGEIGFAVYTLNIKLWIAEYQQDRPDFISYMPGLTNKAAAFMDSF